LPNRICQPKPINPMDSRTEPMARATHFNKVRHDQLSWLGGRGVQMST
jgi:hypothetical protein